MRTRTSKIRNHSIHRNTSNCKTEHRQSHIRDVAEDPNWVPIVTEDFQAFWLLINIYHIITWQDCDSPVRNALGNKQGTGVTEAIKQKNRFFGHEITDNITVRECQSAEEDDPKVSPGSKTAYLKKISTCVGFTRKTSTLRMKTHD